MEREIRYKILSPYIRFAGDLFCFVAVNNKYTSTHELPKIESELNKEFKAEGSHLVIANEFSENLSTYWEEDGFILYIHVIMWG